MKKKLVGIFVCVLLTVVTISPVIGIDNNNENGITCGTSIKSETPYLTTSKDDVDWWPMFHHDLNHTGNSSSPTAPETNHLLWTYTTGMGGIESSPAVIDGRVYCSSDDEYFYCLNATTGTKIWRYFIRDGTGIGSPAIYNGKVYIGVNDKDIICLDAYNGSEVWVFNAPSGLKYSPSISDNKVYIPRSGGDLYCLDAGSGDELWKYDLGKNQASSPTVYESKVYIGLHNGTLCCLDANSGKVRWIKKSYGGMATPTIFDGKVYSGGFGIHCLYPENGTKIWSYTKASSIVSSPAVAYGKIYFVGREGEAGVHCIDAKTGEKIWYYYTSNHEHCFSSPAIADGKVYVGIFSTGKLICLDADTGEFIWDYKVANAGWLFSSPSVANGVVYMGGSLTNKIYAFGGYEPPPDVPDKPSGPTKGVTNIKYTY